jgi:hypothetical protein
MHQEEDHHIDTPETDTSRSSFDTPEVNAAGRPPVVRVRKPKQQETQIAEPQAKLLTRETEIEDLHQRVLKIMTDESLTTPFPCGC